MTKYSDSSQNKQKTVMVCLVSTFATPNVTPVLDKKYKPDEVVLLVSPQMKAQGEWLQAVLRGKVEKVSVWPMNHPWDVDAIYVEIQRLLDSYTEQNVILNASCGTKPMTIACHEAFRERNRSVFYIDPVKDHLIWAYPYDGARNELADRIRLSDFLRLYGGQTPPPHRKKNPEISVEFGELLIRDTQRYERPLATLNYYAGTAKRDLRSAELDESARSLTDFETLTDRLQKGGLMTVEKNRILFSDEDARFFANGGWLEHYVFAQLLAIKADDSRIQDAVLGLEVERRGGVRNEMDVAFLCNNTLHLIECKARSYRGRNSKSATGMLYKIDSLSDILGGIQARAMIVSYRKLPNHDRMRAQELGIELVEGQQLLELDKHLRGWMSDRKN